MIEFYVRQNAKEIQNRPIHFVSSSHVTIGKILNLDADFLEGQAGETIIVAITCPQCGTKIIASAAPAMQAKP
jgi:hypothetical protein